LTGATLFDVTPTILRWLNAPVPEGLIGRALTGGSGTR
jgi:hypothetical protein